MTFGVSAPQLAFFLPLLIRSLLAIGSPSRSLALPPPGLSLDLQGSLDLCLALLGGREIVIDVAFALHTVLRIRCSSTRRKPWPHAQRSAASRSYLRLSPHVSDLLKGLRSANGRLVRSKLRVSRLSIFHSTQRIQRPAVQFENVHSVSTAGWCFEPAADADLSSLFMTHSGWEHWPGRNCGAPCSPAVESSLLEAASLPMM